MALSFLYPKFLNREKFNLNTGSILRIYILKPPAFIRQFSFSLEHYQFEFEISEITMEINIRKATIADKATIVKFQLLMAKETEEIELNSEILEKGVQAILSNPTLGQYFIAESDDAIIACLMTTFEWSDWRNSMVWWLQSVYVLPEYRREGVFKKMYAYIKELISGKDEVAGIRLYMVTSNARAAKVYENVGMDGDRYKMYEWLKYH
jgi:GNAT superfamily N-acetyltransferase